MEQQSDGPSSLRPAQDIEIQIAVPVVVGSGQESVPPGPIPSLLVRRSDVGEACGARDIGEAHCGEPSACEFVRGVEREVSTEGGEAGSLESLPQEVRNADAVFRRLSQGGVKSGGRFDGINGP